jgi:hypothetical protein
LLTGLAGGGCDGSDARLDSAATEPALTYEQLDQQYREQHDQDQYRGVGNREAKLAGFDAADDIGGRHVVFG